MPSTQTVAVLLRSGVRKQVFDFGDEAFRPFLLPDNLIRTLGVEIHVIPGHQNNVHGRVVLLDFFTKFHGRVVSFVGIYDHQVTFEIPTSSAGLVHAFNHFDGIPATCQDRNACPNEVRVILNQDNVPLPRSHNFSAFISLGDSEFKVFWTVVLPP